MNDGTPLDNQWTAFVQMRPINGVEQQPSNIMHKIVSHVTFELHSTYKGQKVHRFTPRAGINEVSYQRVAWGYFDLPTAIHFKPELKL